MATMSLHLKAPTFDMADVNMTINGEENSDTLSAAEGLDILNGEAGDDVLFGDQGNYSLIGGTGVDIFEFLSPVK